jgi:membrane protease YdiL (CAAX protease family)
MTDLTDNAATASTTPSLKSRIAWVFVGSQGLRAGWSILAFLLLVVLIAAGANYLLKLILHPHPGGGMTADRTFIGEGLVAFSLLTAAGLMSLIERRPFARYGFHGHRWLSDLLIGLAWGLVMLSALVGLLAATHALVIDGVALAPVPATISGLKWLAAFVLVGLVEEFLFRGYLQFTLARGIAGIARAIAPASTRTATIGFWVAAIVLSVGLFAASHISNGGESLLGLTTVGLAGIVFVYSLWRTGALWWAIGFHASWDWAQSYLYGVADSGLAAQGHLLNSHPIGAALLSGGNVGPEGSILVVPVLLVVLLIIHITLPKRDIAPA